MLSSSRESRCGGRRRRRRRRQQGTRPPPRPPAAQPRRPAPPLRFTPAPPPVPAPRSVCLAGYTAATLHFGCGASPSSGLDGLGGHVLLGKPLVAHELGVHAAAEGGTRRGSGGEGPGGCGGPNEWMHAQTVGGGDPAAAAAGGPAAQRLHGAIRGRSSLHMVCWDAMPAPPPAALTPCCWNTAGAAAS